MFSLRKLLVVLVNLCCSLFFADMCTTALTSSKDEGGRGRDTFQTERKKHVTIRKRCKIQIIMIHRVHFFSQRQHIKSVLRRRPRVCFFFLWKAGKHNFKRERKKHVAILKMIHRVHFYISNDYYQIRSLDVDPVFVFFFLLPPPSSILLPSSSPSVPQCLPSQFLFI